MDQPISIVILIAIGLSLGLAYQLSKQVVKPLNDIVLDKLSDEDLSDVNKTAVYEEITPLVKKIRMQQQQLKRKKTNWKRNSKSSILLPLT